MDMNQIAVEIAYADGFDAGKQAATEQNSLIGRPCFYQKPYNTDTTFALIKEVQIKQNAKGKEAIATLDNGVVAVLHTYGCPDFIGRAVWGFLTEAECKEYWDM